MPSNTQAALRVMVVDDSAVVRQVMTAVLSQRGFEVTVAADPLIAIQKMVKSRPDVIVLDLEMPRMDGLTFLRKLMSEDPLPVLVCSGHAGRGTGKAIQALEEGAVDIITKPKIGVRGYLEDSAVLLEDAVRGAARARVKRRRSLVQQPLAKLSADAVLTRTCKIPPKGTGRTIVAVGASTGGTEALAEFLRLMPHDCPGIVIVQHMPGAFTEAFANRLNQLCSIEVKEARTGDQILPGRALVAPGDRHTVVRARGSGCFAEVVDGPLVSRHRPSVDVLFRSVAQTAGPNSIGVIMTGMGDDGAQGLLEMKQAGAVTIAQDETTCVVFGMPREAIARGAVDHVIALPKIPETLLRMAAHAANLVRPPSLQDCGVAMKKSQS